MNYSTLLSSIFTYLETIDDIPDIFYPNIKYETIPDEYLNISVMPIDPSDIGVKNIVQHSGLIQIDIAVKVGTGEIRSAEIADIIIEAFKRNTVIPTSLIRIDATPYKTNGYISDNFLVTPITIEYNRLMV